MTTAYADRDSGASLNLLLKTTLNDTWFLISRSNLASRDHFDERFLGYTGAGVGYTINRNWSVRVGYRHLWFRPRTRWLEENRPYAEGYWQRNTGDWRLTARTRLEWRQFNYRENDRRVRVELVVASKAKYPVLGASPYLEHEVFYGVTERQVEANWLGAGLAWRPYPGTKAKLGYRWNRFRVGNRWLDRDVLVMGLNLFF